MRCPNCDRSNLDGARFCDGCGAELAPSEATATPAATGPTVRLPEPVPGPALPAMGMNAAASLPPRPRALRLRQMNGGLWLIGLGMLFLTGTFWPGILVLIGISAYLEETARGRHQEALRTLIFTLGLAVLFALGWFWPGILILLGLTALLSPEVRRSRA